MFVYAYGFQISQVLKAITILEICRFIEKLGRRRIHSELFIAQLRCKKNMI